MRRRIVVALALFAAPLAVVGACTFPDVTFATPDGGASTFPDGPATAQETGTETGPGPTTGPRDEGGITIVDGAVLDAVTRDDSSTPINPDAGFDACRGPICDCDNDHHRKTGCDAGGVDTKNEPFDDCDDLDPIRHPGQDYSDTQPPSDENPPPPGDWNCDGYVTKGYVEGPGWCKWNLQSLSCPSGAGFITNVECGQPANLYDCIKDGLLPACKTVLSTTASPNNRPQVCR